MNETGTVLFYSPGMLTGGTVTHKCHKARAVSYYLEVHSNPKLEILNVNSGLISVGSILFEPFTGNINRLHYKLIQ